jgi:flagellin
VAQRNSQDGISMVQTAEGALSETTNILQRIRELAVQAANGTQSTTNRTALNTEVQQLLAQIDDIALDTEFNGVRVLSATAQTITLQAGAQASQTLLVTVSGAKTSDLKVNNLSIATDATATSSISTVDLALRSVTTLRSTLGAFQNRLEFTIATLAIQEENSAASESAIRDADIARETIAFTRNQILVSAGTSVLAQANIVPQTALQLLG